MATPPDKKKPTAKEKIADQRKMKKELAGALNAGRLAAATETRVRVKAEDVDERAPKKAKRGAIPRPPAKKAAAPPTGLPNKKGPIKPKKKAAPSKTAAPKDAKRVAWDPKRLSQFVAGVITLGELEGISKDEQYEMAQLGHQMLKQGKLGDAKKVFDGLVALDPRDAYFHLALGSIAQRNDQLEEADARYTAALKINPASPHALANRGEVRMMLGRMVDGAKDLMRALEEDPEGQYEATKRARATIAAVMQQLEAHNKKKAAARKGPPPGPRKKKGIRPRKPGPIKKS